MCPSFFALSLSSFFLSFLNIFSDIVTSLSCLLNYPLVLNIVLFSLLDTIDRVVPIVFTNATKINEIAEIIGRYDVISLLLSALLW